jgi:hypothetical protein
MYCGARTVTLGTNDVGVPGAICGSRPEALQLVPPIVVGDVRAEHRPDGRHAARRPGIRAPPSHRPTDSEPLSSTPSICSPASSPFWIRWRSTRSPSRVSADDVRAAFAERRPYRPSAVTYHPRRCVRAYSARRAEGRHRTRGRPLGCRGARGVRRHRLRRSPETIRGVAHRRPLAIGSSASSGNRISLQTSAWSIRLRFMHWA